MSRIRLGRAALAALALAVVAVSYWRLFYGVDFTDEAWYVAVPYRFVDGGKPYVDELSVPQTTAAVLLYPFLWLYHAAAGRTGIVLFVRQLHFLVAAAVGAAVVVSLRRLAGVAMATLAGLAVFLFVPFDIPSVSYDSLGAGLFAAGSLLGYLTLGRPRARPWAGLCLGLAAFAYPPLVLGVAASCAARLWLQPGARRGEALGVTLPAFAIPAAGFALLAAISGPHRIVSDYRRSSHYLGQAGGLTKLHGIAAHLRETLPLWYLVAAGLLLLAWSWLRGWSWLAALAVVVLPLTTLPTGPGTYTASLNYVAHAGFLALPFAVGLRERRAVVELVVAVWLPALVGGVVTAYSSANGGVNFGVGFLPALVVTVVLAGLAVAKLRPGWTGAAAAPGVVIVALLLYFGSVPVYRDGSLSSLTTQVGSGPYAGLVTSRAKQVFLTGLGRDLDGVGSSCTIAFFNDFPAGYLLTAAHPDTSAVWTATVPDRLTFAYHGDLVRYYRTHGFPDVVVEMRRIPFAPPRTSRREHYAPADPLIVAIRTHGYRTVARRLDYVVYRRASC
jgi:hypothetical protein